MIELTRWNGGKELLNVNAIARVSEASASSQGYGIRSIIKLSDGQVIECAQTVDEIALLFTKDKTNENFL